MFFSINRWYKRACRKLDTALKKANKYNMAINLVESSNQEDKTKLQELAALHEEAGSLLKAADCYEKVGEFKNTTLFGIRIYHGIELFPE